MCSAFHPLSFIWSSFTNSRLPYSCGSLLMFKYVDLKILFSFSSESVLNRNTNCNKAERNILNIQVFSSVENFRVSYTEMLCKKPVLNMFGTFSGKRPWRSPILVKLQNESSNLSTPGSNTSDSASWVIQACLHFENINV